MISKQLFILSVMGSLLLMTGGYMIADIIKPADAIHKIRIDCTNVKQPDGQDVELALQNIADPAYFNTNEKWVSLSFVLRSHICHSQP